MLGHALLRSWSSAHDVRVTLRRSKHDCERFGIFTDDNAFYGVDVRSIDSVRAVVRGFRPELVVNAVGVIKQRAESKEAIASIYTNALFPHLLAECCGLHGARLVHLSTDCVFSGNRGMYEETDFADGDSLYGRSKFLGEIAYPHALTLRTSIIGLELEEKSSLIEWYLAQNSPVNGFSKAIYSGFTTAEMARIIEHVAMDYPELNGVYHVASAPVSKYDLLRKLSALLGGRAATVSATDDFVCDRSLNASRFGAMTGYVAPSWDRMLSELADEIVGRDGESASE